MIGHARRREQRLTLCVRLWQRHQGRAMNPGGERGAGTPGRVVPRWAGQLAYGRARGLGRALRRWSPWLELCQQWLGGAGQNRRGTDELTEVLRLISMR
eukprot:scaffold61514_cov45-Prasinocladus_malaysianus.AAC.2